MTDAPSYALGKLRDFVKDWERSGKSVFTLAELRRYLDPRRAERVAARKRTADALEETVAGRPLGRDPDSEDERLESIVNLFRLWRRELVARWLYGKVELLERGGTRVWERRDETEREGWRREADELLERLERFGLPADPSEAAEQEWFWTEHWQKKEREVDEAAAAGEVEVFDDADSFQANLDELAGLSGKPLHPPPRPRPIFEDEEQELRQRLKAARKQSVAGYGAASLRQLLIDAHDLRDLIDWERERRPVGPASSAEREKLDYLREDYGSLERWALENSAGNDWARQVAYFARARLDEWDLPLEEWEP